MRCALALQRYDYIVKDIPGKDNVFVTIFHYLAVTKV